MENLLSQVLMTPDQGNQMLGWVNYMLSKNLYPQERERFSKAERGLEGYLENQRQAVQTRKRRGLLWQLMGEKNPNLFMGEQLTGGRRGIPGSTGGVEILPEETPSTWIRDFVPNPSEYTDKIIRAIQRMGTLDI